APVLRPAAFVVLGAKWKLLAVADCRDSAAADSQCHQVILGGLRALGAQRDIVFLGAALIAMTLDLDPGLRMRLQPARIGFQHGVVLLLNRVLVVGEVNVAERALRAEFSVLPVLERIAAALADAVFTKLASTGIAFV